MIRKHKYYKLKHRQYNSLRSNRGTRLPQLEEKINILKIKKIISIIFFSSCFFWFVYFFLLSNFFFIKTIKISGNKNISENDLQTIIHKQFKAKKWFIFSNNNIFLFNKQNLIYSIKKKYIINDIKIKKKLPFTLKIELEEKLARVVLRIKTPISIAQNNNEEDSRNEEKKDIIGDKEYVSHNIKDIINTDKNREEEIIYSEDYYYLDVNGIIVSSEMVTENDLLKFPVIEILTSDQTEINPGDNILSREKIEFVFKAYETIHASRENILLDYIIIDPNKDNEIIFITQEGWQGFLSTQISLKTQIKKLELALHEKIKDKRSKLQYVDLRIKDRVYFK